MPAGLEVEEDIASGDDEDDGDKKKRSSRTAVKDVRQRVRRAMQQEQMDSDESDKDFGFNAQNPEEEDVQIDSTELDSASDVEKNPENDHEKDQDGNAKYNGISAKKDEKEIRSKKRKRPDSSETTTTSLPIKTENTNEKKQ